MSITCQFFFKNRSLKKNKILRLEICIFMLKNLVFKNAGSKDFPSGPEAKTQLPMQGTRLDPWSGN